MKVVIPMEIEAEDLWSDVFGSGWEHMDWWVGVKYEGDADWDKPGTVILKSFAPDDESKTVLTRIGIEDIVQAYTTLTNKGWTHCGGSALSDPDACTSDAILQTIVYGEFIYG